MKVWLQATTTYFMIRMISAPFALGNYVILGWLLGLGKSVTTLGIQALLNGTNIIFSIYLGLSLEWGIAGVAIATIIGEVLAFIIGIIVCWRVLDHSIRPSRKRVMDRTAWVRLLNMNGDIMVRSFALLFAFAYFVSQGAGFGEITLAANAILLHFFLISGYFLDGLATAAEQIIGRSIGARHKVNFWRGFKLTLLWNAIMAFVLALIFYGAGSALISLMTTSVEVQVDANLYLIWVVIIPLTGMLAFQMDGVFIGATWSRDMNIMMLVSLAAYMIVWALVREEMGNHGLWFALHIFLIVRGITLALRLLPRSRQAFPVNYTNGH